MGHPAVAAVPCACRSISISTNEEQLALSLAGGPAFTLALNNQELMKANDMNFELLGPGVHTAGEGCSKLAGAGHATSAVRMFFSLFAACKVKQSKC